MVFSSTIFLLFFLPLSIVLYYSPILKKRKSKNLFLLIISLLFYGYGEPLFIFLLLASICINYFFGLKVSKVKHKKKYLVFAYSYNLLMLFIFKYLTFFVKNVQFLFKTEIDLNITLPLGISFFTFQMLSYVIDVYRNPKIVQKNIINVALYISFFPQLIAGPIIRFENISTQIEQRKENISLFSKGMYRFIYGLGKKVLLSNYVGMIASNIFHNIRYGPISVITAWIGAISYSLQIYLDFSGYSDMAIGLGGMFGFKIDENFDYPYMAKSITDFWRRWHISLSSWFRDYVYIPLGGNRCSKQRQIYNMFIVWLFTGLWHGANWTFIIWGLFYFVLLILEKQFKIDKKLGVFSHIYTLFFVIISWVIFKSDNLNTAIKYISNMFGIKNVFYDKMALDYLRLSGLIIPACILASTTLIKYLFKRVKINGNIKSVIKVLITFVIFIFSMLACISSTYNPFIYFNF